MTVTQEEDLIVQVVSRHAVRDQAMLIDKLQQAGVTMTQATLSRRLRQLSVAKVGGVYCVAPTGSSRASSVLNVEVAPPNLLVIKTLPGHAGSVAAQIDSCGQNDSGPTPEVLKNIIGTVAGDDTVLVVVGDSKQLRHVQQTLTVVTWLN